ncbi:hypothetical protein SAMN04488115_103457 [Bosea lathyri]|uniref:Uncharacterized protein n=1 Tax=Bosea lathyri TaxID=1036778 RepID=A0A1H5XZ84_9HYPH|nr:hypothetical protein SAMN04488115_103457 [Bosea lathyri]
MGVFHDAGIADREAFSFERQNVGDHAIGVHSERQSIIACSTWPLLFFGIWIVRFTRQKAFVDQVQMLEFLIVKAEEERWNHPIGVSDRSEVLHREHAKRFPKIPLKRYAIEHRRIMCGRVMRRIIEGRQIVLEARSYPTPGIVQRFLNIGDQFITQWAKGTVNFSPNP